MFGKLLPIIKWNQKAKQRDQVRFNLGGDVESLQGIILVIRHKCYQIDPMVSNECSNVEHKSNITSSVDDSTQTIMLVAQLTTTKKST